MPLLVLSTFLHAAAPTQGILAWSRFDDSPQAYRDTRYRFLGDGDLVLQIDIAPKPGHALHLLWGAKNDTREAILTINTRSIPLRHGGYDGFEWLAVPLPKDLAGERYDITLRAGPGKAAFLAEIRLAAPEGVAPDMKPAISGVRLIAVPSPGAPAASVEAFPEMRKLWDTPTVPATALPDARLEELFRAAEAKGRAAAEGLYRCRRFVDGWLAHADPKTGLIPRNLNQSREIWNGRDSAADNYPFMVLTCALTDRALFDGRMLDMLRTETRLTSRIDRLPDDWHFGKQAYARAPNLDAMIFDGAEYVKDGLLPLTEWLGPSPWSERMIGIIDDIWKNAPIDTPHGKIPTLNFEVNGDLLQACSRLYWFTGDRKYLDWAMRLGDYYLLGDRHPTRNMARLYLLDHGCEVINGLTELYVACSVAAPAKREAYRQPLHDMFEDVLKLGRNPHGMLYAWIEPAKGAHAPDICDTWGYNYDGVYTVYLLDRKESFRAAVRQALENLQPHYTGHRWQGGSADGYADSIEGAINLLNREPIASAGAWIDSETRVMWSKQKPDGVIEGWHGDGNFARTTIMHALWKQRGATIQPWREDVRLGAAADGGVVCLSLISGKDWQGKVLFDRPRHRQVMRLPLDYPRINQFPEWFTVDDEAQYTVRDPAGGVVRSLAGRELREGLNVELKAGREQRWIIAPAVPVK